MRFLRVALVAALGLAAGLGPARPAMAERVANLGLGPEVDSLDPHRSTTVVAGSVFVELWEGLTTFDAAGNVMPGVAERWETSADGLSWTFHLRGDARWSDGSPVTADDFVASWRRAVSPATRLVLPDWVGPIRNALPSMAGKVPPEELGVRAEGPNRLVVTLEHPKPDFLIYTAYWPLYPLHRPSLAAHGDGFVQPGKLVGNGPFVLAEAVPQSHIRLARNPHYHRAGEVTLDGVVFHVTEDQQTELKRFRAGELHATRSIPTQQLDWVRENLPDSVRLAMMASTFYLMPNLTQGPLAESVALRRALLMSVDRELLVGKVTRGGEEPAPTVTPPGIGSYVPPKPDWAAWPQAKRDAEAKRLVAEAGYGPGGKPLAFELLYNTSEVNRQVAVAVAAMWQAKLGAKVTLSNQEFKVVVGRIRERSWPGLIRVTWTVPMVVEYMNVMRSRSHLGPGYRNPAFDAAMERVDRAVTLEGLHAALAEAERIAQADATLIPLFHQTSRRMVSPRLKGWVDNPLDIHPARFLSLE